MVAGLAILDGRSDSLVLGLAFLNEWGDSFVVVGESEYEFSVLVNVRVWARVCACVCECGNWGVWGAGWLQSGLQSWSVLPLCVPDRYVAKPKQKSCFV